MICPRCGFDNLPGNDDCTKCLVDLAQLDGPNGQDRVQASLIADHVSSLHPHQPTIIPSNTTLEDAIRLMTDTGADVLLITSDDAKIIGMLTERDLLHAADLFPAGFSTHRVTDHMTKSPATVTPDDTLARALQKMDVGGLRQLPVVTDGKPIGVICVQDLIRHLTQLCRD